MNQKNVVNQRCKKIHLKLQRKPQFVKCNFKCAKQAKTTLGNKKDSVGMKKNPHSFYGSVNFREIKELIKKKWKKR